MNYDFKVFSISGDCPEGYYNEWGYTWNEGEITVTEEYTMTDCGADCTNNTECCAFEFSYSTSKCILQSVCKPTHVKNSDYYYCTKDKDLGENLQI